MDIARSAAFIFCKGSGGIDWVWGRAVLWCRACVQVGLLVASHTSCLEFEMLTRRQGGQSWRTMRRRRRAGVVTVRGWDEKDKPGAATVRECASPRVWEGVQGCGTSNEPIPESAIRDPPTVVGASLPDTARSASGAPKLLSPMHFMGRGSC